jgi:hypothetical protein
MATEWTEEELLAANKVVLARTEIRIPELMAERGRKGMPTKEDAYEATEDVAIELACQRNRALAALKIARGPYVAHMYGHEGYAEGIKQIDAAIAACKKGR